MVHGLGLARMGSDQLGLAAGGPSCDLVPGTGQLDLLDPPFATTNATSGGLGCDEGPARPLVHHRAAPRHDDHLAAGKLHDGALS